MKVVEPTEIFGKDQKQSKPKSFVFSDAFLRFLARGLDYGIFFLYLIFAKKILSGYLKFGRYDHFVPFEFFVWIPIEACFLTFWGKTLGKWFLNIELKRGRSKTFDFITSLRRSFNVWLKGLGLGIFPVNIFCLLFSFYTFQKKLITSWDRDDHIQVIVSKPKKWKIYLTVLVASGLILYYYLEKNLGLLHVKSSLF